MAVIFEKEKHINHLVVHFDEIEDEVAFDDNKYKDYLLKGDAD